MRSCYFYLKPADAPPNPEQIRKSLAEGSVQDKIKTLKQFIKCLVNDDTYPPMIMVIITNIIPLLSKHPELRKVLLLYWEVIEKNKSANDPTLKDEMFLACNSLRIDLLSHNEYLRGRTLRLVSRIMHKGVIEPLSSAITQNINHKSAYVRRNTVVCLYNVFMNFGSDIIGEIDEEIENLLKVETDLSTKRNAFILLSKSNPVKAMDYLQQQINAEALEDIGDILQLAILKVLKQKARQQPTGRSKFLKIINSFTYKASQSVLLECSITSLAISNSVLSIKTALSAYVNILTRTNELNVKKIVLDKLQTACRNSNYIEESLVEDLIKNLKTPSYEIKVKILNIVTLNLNPKIGEVLLSEFKKQVIECTDNQYLYKIIKSLETIASKFVNLHPQTINFVLAKIFKLENLSTPCAESISRCLRQIIEKSDLQAAQLYKKQLVENFRHIRSQEIIKEVLNIFGNLYYSQAEVELAIDGLRNAIGSLPITIDTVNPEADKKEEAIARPKVQFRTKILEDGSYLTEIVEQEESQQQNEKLQQTYFRKLLAQDSIVGGVFTRSIGKMLYRIRKGPEFNKNACSVLMILCSLLRNYQEHLYQVDQATIDQISTLIRKVVNTQNFINSVDETYEVKKQNSADDQMVMNESNEGQNFLEKNPSDLIFFRQLKKGIEAEDEFDDEEVNQILNEVKQKQSFVQKLKSMVQLTGVFDPLYAQSFITVSKTDIFFEILLVNTTKSNMLNVQIQFASTSQILILQKAQSINLRPFESVSLRTQIRFVTGEFGSIYGYINYDNQAGIEQPYIITEEIKIDFMQFVVPASISEQQFKLKWAQNEPAQLQFEAEIKPEVDEETQQASLVPYQKIYQLVEQQLHCQRVCDFYEPEPTTSDSENNQQFFLSRSFYGKSKIGEDFLLVLTLFRNDPSIDVTFNIRSKESSLSSMVMKKVQQIDFEEFVRGLNDDEDETDQ